MTTKHKPRKRGRPITYVMPPPIPDTLENIARAVLTTPSKKRHDWNFMKPGGDGYSTDTPLTRRSPKSK